MTAETALAAGYGTALVAVAFVIEWMSAHTHRRSLRYRTAGFTYDAGHDHWICPEGEHLWPHEYDHERRFVRYRAKANICNGCPLKDACTDSDSGREIVRPVDPWPHSEAGRFHRAVAVLLVVAAILVYAVGIARSGEASGIVLLALLTAGALIALVVLARDLRRHPAGFPDPTAAHGLRIAQAGGSEARPDSIWASQRRGAISEDRWGSSRRNGARSHDASS